MEEKKKHKVMIGIEVILLGMIIAIVGTNAASSNPPSNGVSYSKNNQTTVEGALNDLYNKANYGNASAGQILSGKTALVGGKQVTGTIVDRTNDTGTIGLAWSTSNYQTVGNQLRIGVSKGYYGTNNYSSWGTSGIVFDDYQKKLGITADKILKGQSIAGINGTGETTCPTCPTCLNTSDATATAADISKDKTAYVNGKKITGTGMLGKTYEFSRKKATVSGQTFVNGTWTKMNNDSRTSFSIDLGFTPKEVHACLIELSGNYASDNDNRWDADFRIDRGYPQNSTTGHSYWYMTRIPNNLYISNSDSVTKYTDTMTKCRVSGSQLIFDIDYVSTDNSVANGAFWTRTNEFYLSGVLAYD